MIYDKYLFSNLPIIGAKILREANLDGYPKNHSEMELFLNAFKKGLENNSFASTMLGNVIYNFITEEEVRLRRVTSTMFEELFAALFDTRPSDEQTRFNPEVPKEIKELDQLTLNEDWSISSDLSKNKREKVDVHIGSYEISLKTLKGKLYNSNHVIVDSDVNTEVNLGSFSIRALFKGLFLDEYLKTLSDRKGGLGSGKQIQENIIDRLIKDVKLDAFIERLEVFLKYVYTEDIYLVMKSGYLIEFYLIPNNSFHSTLLDLARNEIDQFSNVFYRWENNNLRLNWVKLLNFADKYEHNYSNIIIPLRNIENYEISSLNNKINQIIKEEFKKNIEN